MGASESSMNDSFEEHAAVERTSHRNHTVERRAVEIKVDSKTIDDVAYTIVDGPATSAAKGSTAASSTQRLKALRHPNILAFSRLSEGNTATTRKGSVMGLPLVHHLPDLLSPVNNSNSRLSPSEALYGIRGVAEALAMCASAGVFFKSLASSQVGVARISSKCHPVNAHRWILLDFTTADGASVDDSAKAFIAFVDDVFSAFGKSELTFFDANRSHGSRSVRRRDEGGAKESDDHGEGAVPRDKRMFPPGKAWLGLRDGNPFDWMLFEDTVVVTVDEEIKSNTAVIKKPNGENKGTPHSPFDDGDDGPPLVPGLAQHSEHHTKHAHRHSEVKKVSSGQWFFRSVLAFIDGLHDPLLEAMQIGQSLPSYYAADSTRDPSSSSLLGGNNNGVSDELQQAYERLRAVVRDLSGATASGRNGDQEDEKGEEKAGEAGSRSKVYRGGSSSSQELYRCVFPWLIAPEHLAQPVSAHLFTDLLLNAKKYSTLTETRGSAEQHPFSSLIRSCLASCDPFLNTRFFAHAAHFAPIMSDEELFLVIEGAVFTCFFTSASLVGSWDTLSQLRYCRACVKAAENYLAEMRSRAESVGTAGEPSTAEPAVQTKTSSFFAGASRANASKQSICSRGSVAFAAAYASLAEELKGLLFSAILAAEAMESDHIAEIYRLLRDVLVAMSSLITIIGGVGMLSVQAQHTLGVARNTLKKAMTMSLYQWSHLTREQCVSVVLSAAGTTIPKDMSGFLLAAMLSLCGSEEGSIRNAACSGLLRLKGSIGTICCEKEDEALIAECAALAAEVGESAAGGVNAAGSLLGSTPRSEGTAAVLQTFVAMESKRLNAAGYGEGAALITSFGKERSKLTSSGAVGAAPSHNLFNAIFRNGSDKPMFVAVLFHSAF